MKKYLCFLAGLLLFLASCTTIKTPAVYDAGIIDYGQYLNEGFFLTESDYAGFEFEPVGSVFATVASGYATTTNSWGSAEYSKNPTIYTVYDALEAAIDKSKELGADGILKLRISVERRDMSTTMSLTDGSKVSSNRGDIYTVTGMAIKRGGNSIAKKPAVVNKPIEKEQSVASPSESKSKTGESYTTKIKKAKELLDSGAITQSEFDQIKKQALTEMSK